MKYLLLDFGNVIAYATTGDWFMTPKFENLVDINKFDKKIWYEKMIKYNLIKDGVMMTLKEEEEMFKIFYQNMFKEFNYPVSSNIIDEIVHNFVYEHDKYTLFEGVKEELDELSKKYKLIMVTDNWPCIYKYLKDMDLEKYFIKIYSSSDFGYKKENGKLFEYPIHDFQIKPGEALFIDDTLKLLPIAESYGLEVALMDRFYKIEKCDYNVLHSLKEIEF